jgi:3-oxoacyl-[acyl-carrier-protein] synthase-3
MRLGQLVPPWVTGQLAALGLKPNDIAHYVLHQPSETIIRNILSDMGVDPDRGIYTHSLYGNTSSASVAVGYHRLLEERTLQVGDKLVLGSAAAGFSMVMATGQWTGTSGSAKESV